MPIIRKARIEDVRNLLDCQTLVLESLRGILPNQFIEYEFGWLQNSERENEIKKDIEEKNTIILVAEKEKKIIGFAQGKVDRRGTSWLAYMGVASSYRRRGIGKALTKRYIDESRSVQAEKISLYATQKMKPAIKLYEGLGFESDSKVRIYRYGIPFTKYSKKLD
jgi:ribosomal protein S18 acetylase RimI-like enzyme